MTFPLRKHRGKATGEKTHPVRIRLIRTVFVALTLACLIVGISACKKSSTRHSFSCETITISTPADIPLKAFFYSPHTPTPIGALIVTSTASEMSRWDILAARLQQSGLTCIISPLELENKDLNPSGSDIDTSLKSADRLLRRIDSARRALVERGVQPENIALIGGDIAAFAALLYVASRPEIPAVVLLSPPLNEFGQDGVDVMTAYGKRACLIMATEGDTFAAAAAHALKQAATGFCELRVYSGSAHGIDLLHSSEQAREQIVVWLEEIFGLP